MDTVTVYTDGSCSPNPGSGGWAYIAIFPDYEIQDFGSLSNTTNNVMELTAVIEPLKYFSEFKNFQIYSDSTYVINCAQGKWRRKANVELWKEYDQVSRGKHVTFTWVEGHVDFHNKRVDALANDARLKKI